MGHADGGVLECAGELLAAGRIAGRAFGSLQPRSLLPQLLLQRLQWPPLLAQVLDGADGFFVVNLLAMYVIGSSAGAAIWLKKLLQEARHDQ